MSLSAGSAFNCTPVYNQLIHLQYNTKVKHYYSHKNGTNNGFCFYIHKIKFGFLLPFWVVLHGCSSISHKTVGKVPITDLPLSMSVITTMVGTPRISCKRALVH
jgi:hypothetical protein